MISKQCRTCKVTYTAKQISEIGAFFSKDYTNLDGYSYKCKECKRAYDRKRNYNREIYKNAYAKYKDIVRAKTKAKYKPQKCSVISCEAIGEFHHIDYSDVDAVIPLCRKHHSAIHKLNNVLMDVFK